MIRVLQQLIEMHGKPRVLRLDNGPELTAVAFTNGNVLAATSPDRTRITFYDGALSELPHGQEITSLHEGFHAAVHTGWDSEPQPLHRAPFNEAAEQLLEQGQ